MSEPKKQEKDFTPEVDAAIPEAQSLVKAGKLNDGIDRLLALEKQTRNGADLKSTTRLLIIIITIAYEAKNFDLLNSNITLLSKKHGQLRDAIKSMVEHAMTWLEEIRTSSGESTWLDVIETLRQVTEGKIFLETPRARLTLSLAKFYERISSDPSSAPPPKPSTDPISSSTLPTKPLTSFEALEKAATLLADLQVETYSSMERKEKTEFILEQMRLSALLAKEKDHISRQKSAQLDEKDKKSLVVDGETEWIKVRVGGRKVHEGFLAESGNEDLKLKYYDLMIQFALRNSSYLDAAKYFYKIWETPVIKDDADEKGREALENIVYYVILSPYDNEQSDMINRLFINPALAKLDLHYNLVKCFITQELMRWPGIESIYGPTLRQTSVFSTKVGDDDASEKRWEDLHTRVIEHNVRVISQYYSRITLTRLTSLLDMSPKETEAILCRLVVQGSVYARIDRPAGIVNFRKKETPEDMLNSWAGDVGKLMDLVEKSWMTMNAALAVKARK